MKSTSPARWCVADNVHKSFGHLEVLKGIDFQVGRGEVSVVIGPSGSGKSTFLRCINHLEKINAGRIWVDGDLVGYRQRGDRLHEMQDKEVAAQRRSIGMVFQRFNLFPHMTALRQRHGGAVPGRAGCRESEGRDRGDRAAAPGRSRATSSTPTRTSSPAVSSSGWPSPERWRWSRS